MALLEVNRQHSEGSRLNYGTEFVPWMLYTEISQITKKLQATHWIAHETLK